MPFWFFFFAPAPSHSFSPSLPHTFTHLSPETCAAPNTKYSAFSESTQLVETTYEHDWYIFVYLFIYFLTSLFSLTAWFLQAQSFLRRKFCYRGLPRLCYWQLPGNTPFISETHSTQLYYSTNWQKSFSDNMPATICAFIATFLTLCGSRGRLMSEQSVRRLLMSEVQAELFYRLEGKLQWSTKSLKVFLALIRSNLF